VRASPKRLTILACGVPKRIMRNILVLYAQKKKGGHLNQCTKGQIVIPKEASANKVDLHNYFAYMRIDRFTETAGENTNRLENFYYYSNLKTAF